MSSQRLPLAPLLRTRYRPRTLVLLPSILAASALLSFISLVLPWHHLDIAGGGYVVLQGYQTASWIAVAGAVVAAFAVRFSRWGFARLSRFWLTVLAIGVGMGMWIDYLNTMTRAVSVFAAPWFGPGFAVGAASTLLLVIGAAVSWRTEE